MATAINCSSFLSSIKIIFSSYRTEQRGSLFEREKNTPTVRITCCKLVQINPTAAILDSVDRNSRQIPPVAHIPKPEAPSWRHRRRRNISGDGGESIIFFLLRTATHRKTHPSRYGVAALWNRNGWSKIEKKIALMSFFSGPSVHS